MQVQELVGIVPWTFVAQICNLFIQAYLIKRFLFKPVNQLLEKRRAMADAEIQQAVQAKEEAAAMKAEYEQSMQSAKDQASELLLKTEIGDMAMEIAGKVIEREISEEDHRKLIDEFIANVGEAS